nr:hypothetical protein BC332_10646 [Ipomoea batatas]
MASVFARIDASPSSLNLPFVAVLFFPKPSLHRNPLLPIFLAFISILILVGNLRWNDDNDAAAEMTGDVEQCSDGDDDRETVACFFDLHEIREDPKNTQYPVMDRRVSQHAAQWEFENALIDKKYPKVPKSLILKVSSKNALRVCIESMLALAKRISST